MELTNSKTLEERKAEITAMYAEMTRQAEAAWAARKLTKTNPRIEAALRAEEMQIAASESRGNR